VGLSVDSTERHEEWVTDINDINGVKLNYPLIADVDRKISILYGMLDPTFINDKGLPYTVRSVFFIDPQRIVRATISYPASTGRNFTEILRVLDSLQLTVSHKVATPVDWQKGEKCVVLPTISTEDAKKIFPKGVEEVRPYLRLTPDPSQ